MKERKKVKPADYLPADITLQILSRASLETLGRCRVVSKEFEQLTYDPNVFQNFSERTKTVSGIFIHFKCRPLAIFVDAANHNNRSGSKVSLTLSDENNVNFKILAASKCGILFCTNMKEDYYVCKPTTKQWQQLPNPNIPILIRIINTVFGMVVFGSRPLRYKIVVFVPRNWSYSKYRCHIFDSETWAWKQLKDPLWMSQDRYYFSYNMSAVVSAGGKLYWRLKDQTNSEIFRFDFENESWESFKLPWPLCKFEYCNEVLLVEYKGRLGLICSFVRRKEQCDCMELWVMDIKGRNIWTKALKFCIKTTLLKELPDICRKPVALLNSDLLIYINNGCSKVILFKLQDWSFKEVELGESLSYSFFYVFQSDLELVNLRGSGLGVIM